MLPGLTLEELARQISSNAKGKMDYITDTSKIRMLLPIGATAPVIELPEHGQFNVLPLAHNHIAERMKIPVRYYDKMFAEAPDLLLENVNTWFRRSKDKNMVRTSRGGMRAFLSNKYQRIEYEEVAAAAFPILKQMGVAIVSSQITDTRMYIQFVMPGMKAEVKKGDVVQAGGIISNSEVGCGAASVTGLLWRLICLNGMKTTEQFRRAHIGRRVEDNEELWSDNTKAADDRVILLKVQDMVRAVVDGARFKLNVDKMKGLTEIKITGHPEKAVEVLTKKIDLQETEGGALLRSLIDGGDLSAWGLLNAVTAQAHNAMSYDRAVELEAAGGMLLDLPAKEWKQVLEAH